MHSLLNGIHCLHGGAYYLILSLQLWPAKYIFTFFTFKQKIKDKHWKKEIVQVSDWPRKTSVTVFRLTRLPRKTPPSYWSPRQSLLHAMWPTRGHGQKPPTTMCSSIWNNRV